MECFFPPDRPINRKGRRNLTNAERESVLQHLLIMRKPDGRLERGATITVGAKFSVSARTVKRIWNRYLETVDGNGVGSNVSSNTRNCGRKRKYENLEEMVKAVAPEERGSSQRDFSAKTGISQSTVCRHTQVGEMKTTTGHLTCSDPRWDDFCRKDTFGLSVSGVFLFLK